MFYLIEHKSQKEGATMRFDRCNLNCSFVALLALTLMLPMPLVLAAETADSTIPASSPQQVVEHALAEMRAVLFQARGNLKDDPLEIFRAIDHIISHNTDIPRISRLMLRRHWRKATDGQREQLVTLFHRFASKLLTLTNSMVSATDESGGSVNITFLPAHISDNDSEHAMVHTLVSFKDAEDMRVKYRLCNDQGAWKIYDVAIDDISFGKLTQASVSSVVRQQGVDGLISLLKQKVSTGYPSSTGLDLAAKTEISAK
jgi:phospholipid transport system substrate-binding protein